MQITITLHCPDCQSTKVVKNGKKSYGKQNYLCKDCRRQFIGDHNLTYKGCLSMIYQKILILLVRVVGIRDIAPETKEIVAWQWGKRNKKTARKLREKLKKLGISFGQICTDNWEAFISVFQEDNHKIGKKYTTHIEGNNTRLRHRIRRAVRKTCCFSKKLENHFKAFEIAFFYINFGYI